MQKHHIKTTISDEGSLIIKELPFSPGDTVEITINTCYDKTKKGVSRYSLRGKPFQYPDPFGSVAENEWDALK
ncbi:conserved hypothetical protein [Candidatus Desulfarcum epimagneticum]|uniref:Uncharacterized protein n=1 Tax=uncultured Desulfobacteraceae bacterium TaxID=218296 RepID=A0A484HMB5_9BACT|nr:conserved hypothetical protein [uncultured Desulfobacteraceae bacterium]